jgi:tetratricopeptide (TPR) repeat protein
MWILRREQGRLQEIEAALRSSVEQYPAIPALRCILVCLYSELGREVEARAEFERLATNDFADLTRDAFWLISMTLLSQVCAFLSDARRAATLYNLLLPYAGRNVVAGRAAVVCYGSMSHYLGLLAATMARWEEATQHFTDAIEMNTKMGARPWLAYTQYEYATMLLARGQPDGRKKALELLDQALGTAQELGMKSLVEKAAALRGQVTGDGGQRTPVAEPISSPSPVLGEGKGEREIKQNTFRKEGEYWTIAYEGKVFRLKAAKGLRYIAYLLRHPGREFHVADLVAATEQQQAEPTGETYNRMGKERLAEESLSVSKLGDAGAMLDSQAKAAYRRRLDDLQEELEEAQRFNDPGRAVKAQEEIDFITGELTAAYGLGSRARKSADSDEKVRKAVTNRIRDSLAKIRKQHPALWQHLFNALKTGVFCSYAPEKPTAWQLS